MRQCKVIKLLLQPIVENAVLHGLKPKKTNCRLTITAQRQDSLLRIRITDNGLGFTSAPAPLPGGLDTRSGVGLQNVNSRIKYTFGPQYGVTMRRTEREETEALFILPYTKLEEDYVAYENIDRG